MSLTRFAALVLVLALCAGGCSMHSGPTAVAQGRYFAAGTPEYDEFFVAIYRLQLQMAAAPAEFAEARRALSETVISAANAPSAQLAEKTKATLERLAEHGPRVRIEFRVPTPPDPERTMALVTPAGSPGGADRKALESIESSLTRILRFNATLHRATARLTELRRAVPRLEAGVDAAFHDQGRSKRTQVLTNLRDADRVSVLMLARADELGKPADELVSEFTRVLAAYFKSPSAAPSEVIEPAPASEAPRARPPENDARPRASGPGPKPKPPPEPPKSADFEP